METGEGKVRLGLNYSANEGKRDDLKFDFGLREDQQIGNDDWVEREFRTGKSFGKRQEWEKVVFLFFRVGMFICIWLQVVRLDQPY